MNNREVAILNSLVTWTAENIPGGLKSDERSVAQIVGQWAIDGTPVVEVCPHCGSPLLHHDGRLRWLDTHINSSAHRMWWSMKKTLERVRRR